LLRLGAEVEGCRDLVDKTGDCRLVCGAIASLTAAEPEEQPALIPVRQLAYGAGDIDTAFDVESILDLAPDSVREERPHHAWRVDERAAEVHVVDALLPVQLPRLLLQQVDSRRVMIAARLNLLEVEHPQVLLQVLRVHNPGRLASCGCANELRDIECVR